VVGIEAGAAPLVLAELQLPAAPPVARARAVPLRQHRAPAAALVVLGVVLVLAPIVGGLFSKVAAGKQLIDEFEPHLEADALARYDSDLAILRAGAAGLDRVVADGLVADGQFPGVDAYRQQAVAIDRRATTLLGQVRAAEPDYRDVAGIGGFDRVPFLIVLLGIVAIYGGCLLLGGGRRRGRPGAALVVVTSAALVAYPFLSDLPSGARAGGRMLDELAPVMTGAQVRALQLDFVVLVQAVGELDTGFRQLAGSDPAAAPVTALVDAWPTVSSDLAGLVGTINDNIDDYQALGDLDGAPGGFAALPWLLIGLGAVGAGLAAAAWPRARKDTA
jgi:hypothetical protein